MLNFIEDGPNRTPIANDIQLEIRAVGRNFHNGGGQTVITACKLREFESVEGLVWLHIANFEDMDYALEYLQAEFPYSTIRMRDRVLCYPMELLPTDLEL